MMQTSLDREPDQHPDVIPRDALCLDCGYVLFGLDSLRCPECGRAFDPSDPRTLWLGRPAGRCARFLISPVGHFTRWAMLIECLVALWGLAWLPGAKMVASYAFLALVITCAYATARGIVRIPLRICYRRLYTPPDANDRRLRRCATVVLALCVAGFFDLPLKVNLVLSRSFFIDEAMRVWTKEPMLTTSFEPGLYGGLIIERADVTPSGVWLHVHWADTVYVTEENGRIEVQPLTRFFFKRFVEIVTFSL